MAEKREHDSRRETRLLLLVVGVSLAVLVLLAQWRFPATDLAVAPPSAAPLAGLAARATFDEMANTLSDVLGRVSPSLTIVRIESVEDPAARESRGRSTGARSAPVTRRSVALRVGRDLGLVHAAPGVRVFAAGDETSPLEIVASDDARRLTFVRLPDASDAPDLLANGLRAFAGLTFATVIEPAPTGPTIQPIFLGRADSILDARWSHPLFVLGPVPALSEGAFVFSVGGRLIGLTERGPDGLVIVPAAALETVLASLVPATVTR